MDAASIHVKKAQQDPSLPDLPFYTFPSQILAYRIMQARFHRSDSTGEITIQRS
jgi:hypothetical protein